MEYYSIIKRHELLIDASKWMNFEDVMLSNRIQSEKITYCMIHLCEMSGIDKSIETVSRLVVARGLRGGGMGSDY